MSGVYPRFEIGPVQKAAAIRQLTDSKLDISNAHMMVDLMEKAIGDAIETFERVLDTIPHPAGPMFAKINGISWLAIHAASLAHASIQSAELVGMKTVDNADAQRLRERIKRIDE